MKLDCPYSEFIKPPEIIHDTEVNYKLYENNVQKIFLVVSLVFLFLIFVFGISSWVKNDFTKSIMIICTYLSTFACQLFALLYCVSVSGVHKALFKTNEAFFNYLTKEYGYYNEYIQRLLNYSLDELRDSLDVMELEISHLKSSIGAIIGAIDKVGIIPLFVGSLFSFYKFWDSWQKLKQGLNFEFDFLDYGLYTVLFIYLVSLYFYFYTHRLDKFANMLKMAIKKKEINLENEDQQG